MMSTELLSLLIKSKLIVVNRKKSVHFTKIEVRKSTTRPLLTIAQLKPRSISRARFPFCLCTIGMYGAYPSLKKAEA